MSNAFDYGAFCWFFGEIVDINDPEQIGRVKVKVYGMHTEGQEIAKDALPWAIVGSSTASASNNGIGTLPHALTEGSNVFGFFVDGKMKQVPFILASFPSRTGGNIDVSDLARGTNSIKRTILGPEPQSKYAAKYPHNQVHKTTSGHIIEIDNTPGAERINIHHKSGAYYEFQPDGSVVRKSFKDNFDITVGNGSIYVGGNVTETIGGNYNLDIKGNYSVKVGGNTTINTSGTNNFKSGSSTNMTAGSACNIKASGQVKVNGSVIRLN